MKAFIINMIVIFIIKVVDNILSTSKTILVQKNKAILASITVIISNIIFYKLVDAASSGGEIVIYIIALASGIGTFLAIRISNRFSKERVFVNIIMNDDKEIMKELRDFLKDNKITNLATIGFTKEWNQTLAIAAYAETKEQSKLIDNFIKESNVKFKRIIQVQ